jgi:uncharacterized protein YktA (UPF0223 family)
METVTVKQIHNEFDTASDALYYKAVRSTANRIEKSERLKKLGFISSSEIVKPEEESLPVYYRKEYPFLRFITKEQLENICEKYGLIYAEAKYYTGDIPEKNLQEIENAKSLHEKDFTKVDSFIDNAKLIISSQNERKRISHTFEEEKNKSIGNFSELEEAAIYDMKVANTRMAELISRDRRMASVLAMISGENSKSLPDAISKIYGKESFDIDMNLFSSKNGLYIAANKELFDLKNMRNVKDTNGYIVTPKDPIVFRWCRGGILIITKWGDEANDSELVVPDFNQGI